MTVIQLVESLRRTHLECEDCWYSCPLSDEGCCNHELPKVCNCGAEAHNARVDALVHALNPPEDATDAVSGLSGQTEEQP